MVFHVDLLQIIAIGGVILATFVYWIYLVVTDRKTK